MRLVLVHGATTGPEVFTGWAEHWPGWDVQVPDLQAGLDVAQASMADYADRVISAAEVAPPEPVVLCGWSMGGLVAMMVARQVDTRALVVIEPSVPAEIEFHPDWPLQTGTYEADAYGGPAPGLRHRPESLLARAERKRGISVPDVVRPLLVVGGWEYTSRRSRPVADYYHGQLLEFPDLSHFELVRSPDVMRQISKRVLATRRGR